VRRHLATALWIDGHAVTELGDEHELASWLEGITDDVSEIADVVVCDINMAGLAVLQGLGRVSGLGTLVVLVGACDEAARRVRLLCRGCVIFRAPGFLDDVRALVRHRAQS
jgi:hypothetical protein